MILALTFLLVLTSAHAVSWSYQVNVNNEKGPVTRMEKGLTSFKAGPYKCEVSAIDEKSNTEYRSLSCGVDTVAVSTGG